MTISPVGNAVLEILNAALDRAVDAWINDQRDDTSIPLVDFLMEAFGTPEYRATIRRYLDELDVDEDYKNVTDNELSRLIAENEALKKDIDRYRFRDYPAGDHP